VLADVLVIGGGPAGAWAAVAAAGAGARVVLVDKGYLGTSGATAPANTGTWLVPPGEGRRLAIEQRQPRTGGLADPRWVERTLDTAWEKLHGLADRGYPFPRDDEGRPYLANLRGPDYMHFMRRCVLAAGVTVLDHHPALELLGDGATIAGAAGVDRQHDRPWQVRAGAVVLATGGCAFGERMLGAATLTGDGYLMAAEAGAELSGMELSAQYAFTPKPSAVTRGCRYAGRASPGKTARRFPSRRATATPRWPRRCSTGRSLPGTTGPLPRCERGSGRVSRTASCRSTAPGSIPSPSAGR
jgi:succinate dehydrogenase/fumarate reductase flavoprotein subunit